ncbi:hypothetical protein FB566_3580 [Stackebrandtia endophytica]|uniref:Uncharacterized protein n=1 Tax=Stackebrandtia endophytica TaxID=1496996 RepID=A0A543AZJ2_9ACTN|nr:hypothetical protein FB566_3580 [Stackebrandtia endophytica]
MLAAGALTAGVLLTGCGGESDDAVDPGEIAPITEAVDDAIQMESQLRGVISRLMIDCLTDAGFDVHAPDLTGDPDAWMAEEGFEPLVGSDPPGSRDIPTVAEAEERGVYVGLTLDPDREPDDDDGAWGYDPNDPFFAMPLEYQEEYQLARYGEEYLEAIAPGGDPGGELPVEGGCSGEVNVAVTEATGLENGKIEWPEVMGHSDAHLAEFESETLLSARNAWSSCVEDRGHPYFEFSRGSVDLWNYGQMFYKDSSYYSDSSESYPFDPPTGAPWEFDEAYPKEIAFAVDVAECADDSGLRETMTTEWNRTMSQAAMAHQEAIFAWHDSLEEALEAVQSLLTE